MDAVLEVQLNVVQDVSPILADGVKSSGPKLTPATVMLAPPLAAEFLTESSVIMGESYVKNATPVPVTLSTATLTRARPAPAPTWQSIAVYVVHPAVSHTLPPKLISGERLLTPKLKPVNVTLNVLLVA